MFDQKIMTASELAEQLGVCPHTLRRWFLRGEGPKRYRLGRNCVYYRHEVERWLDEKLGGQAAAPVRERERVRP